MRILLSPQRRDGALTLSRQDDALIVNGDRLDFSAIPDGATLPRGAIDSEWIAGDVHRIGGELHVTLLLPHGDSPSQAVAYPAPIAPTGNGPIALPHGPEPRED